MALHIDTFDNVRGGNVLYKALTHPRAARLGDAVVATLRRNAPVAVYDPADGAVDAFNEFFSLDEVEIAGTYVQQTARIGERVLGYRAAPVTELADSGARAVFIAAFDAERMMAQLKPYVPAGAQVFSLDAMRIPAEPLSPSTKSSVSTRSKSPVPMFSRRLALESPSLDTGPHR